MAIRNRTPIAGSFMELAAKEKFIEEPWL